jgi:hypothetical protein
MSQHICDKCLKPFAYKHSLAKHIKKKVCEGKQYNDVDSKFKCTFCGKGFSIATSMYRHVNHTCKVKKNEDKKKDEIYERLLDLEKKSEKIDILEKENKKLKRKVISLEKKSNQSISNIINNTTNNDTKNINNGIVAHINLIGYGKEDISKIDTKEILRAMQAGYDSTIKLTETLHFNPKYPEYHNIYITNVKDKYAMMFDGNDWNLTMKDELIDKIYDDKKNYIEENMDVFLNSLTLSRIRALERWLGTNDDDKRINKIKNDIKLLLYNKRNIIIDKREEKVTEEKLPKKLTKQSAKKTMKSISRRKIKDG